MQSEKKPSRTVPANEQAEAAVLGAVIIEPKTTVEEVLAILEPADFYRPEHQTVFAAIMALHEEGGAIDVVLVRNKLRKEGQLKAVGNWEFLVDLMSSAPSPANATYYARIVRDARIARDGAGSLRNMAEKLENPANTADTVLTELEDEVARLKALNTLEGERATSLVAMADELLQEDGDTLVSGIKTGIACLDDLLGPLPPGSLTVLAGRPGHCKTALALNILVNLLPDCRISLFSWEEPLTIITRNLLCLQAQKPRQAMIGALRPDDREALVEARQWLADSESQLQIVADHSLGLASVENRVLAFRPNLIILDSLLALSELEMARDKSDASNKRHYVERMMRAARRLGAKAGAHVIMIHHTHREGEKARRAPEIYELFESAGVERDADVVLLAWWPWRTLGGDKPKTEFEIAIAKNRLGGVCETKTLWLNTEGMWIGGVEGGAPF